MRVLLTGAKGQLGFELHKKLLSIGEVIATDRYNLDLGNPEFIRSFLNEIKPDIIVNPAAYTQVDKAENEVKLAYQINALAPKVLTEKAREFNIPIIHFSSGYVFDGLKLEPYLETDKTFPQSVYGKSKLEGEEEVRQFNKHIILRTNWIFASHSNNFLKKILRLIQEEESLNIVCDQNGTPTSAKVLADATSKIIKTIFASPSFKDYGTYHIACDEYTNWHQYASFICEKAIQFGFAVNMTPLDIKPILSCENYKAALRPANSKLNTEKIKSTFMLEFPNWEVEVEETLKKLAPLEIMDL